jgi:GTPase
MSHSLTSGWVGLIGLANSGKSSLFNAALDAKLAIVSPKAQTTRDFLRGYLVKEDCHIGLMDTPGLFKGSLRPLDCYMLDQVRTVIDLVDVIWWVYDASSEESPEYLAEWLSFARKKPIIWVAQKADRVHNPNDNVKGVGQFRLPSEDLVAVSTRHKTGISSLIETTRAYLPKGPPLVLDHDQLTDKPLRYFAQEIIREKLYYCLGQELPYECALKVESFKEEETICKIHATIYPAKDSQKAIVIGKGGLKIKEIGQLARQELESFLGQKVFLGLHVKTKSHWMKDKASLKQFGYEVR